MMNSKKHVGTHGKKFIIIFVLIDLKREIEEDITFINERKNTYIECIHQTKAF